MTTLNTIEDFLRVVREDAEIRAAVRRELLTGELLSLPERVSSLTERVNGLTEHVSGLTERLNGLTEHVSGLTERLSALTQRVIALTESIEVYKEATDRQFDIVINRLDRQHEMYRRQHDDLARFRGNYAIDAARNSDAEIAGLFAQLRGMLRIQVRSLGKDELDAMLNDNLDAVEALRLGERAWLTFPKADVIAEVTERRNSGPGFYIAVEASYTGGIEDFLRATDHAKILRRISGQDAYAVVAGVRKGPSVGSGVLDDIEEFVAGNNEDTAFWHQLKEDGLEPLDPC